MGDVAAEAITLITSDAGKTWRSLRAVREAWSSVNAALDGTLVVAAGGRDGSPSATTSTVQAARVSFGALDAQELNAPSPLSLISRVRQRACCRTTAPSRPSSLPI